MKENKKRILIISLNYFPEDSAIGFYSTQMSECLNDEYDISVITGFPYYPEWKIRDDYLNKKKYTQEERSGIRILRYKQYVPKKPTFFLRILHLIDFTLGSVRNLFKIKKTCLVIVVVPFIGSIILGAIVAKVKKAKLWVHVQDFEFDAALEAGVAKKNSAIKSALFKLLFRIEKKLFNKVDVASTISNGMLEKLNEKTTGKTILFTNWVDEKFIAPEKTNTHEYLASKKFKILYSGNIGAKQDWELFLKIVKYFNSNDDIAFIIVGDGAKREWLGDNIKGLNNVVLYSPVEYDRLKDLLCSADMHILLQRKDVIDTVMPSKVLGMMASAKPSLITGNKKAEIADVILESNGGFYFEPTEYNKIINTILYLFNNPNESKVFGENARKYIIEKFSREIVLKNFKENIKEIIGG